MREAAERRQQLELEHEQALAILNSKQKEIELLQKAQVEAKKEHEGAIQLLEITLDSMQFFSPLCLPRPKSVSSKRNAGRRVSNSTSCPRNWKSFGSKLGSLIF
ncbi:PREDICTED: RIMS-binding protein 2-like [Thamnophis sirtalis]|uniref:RIMS-binding protein 2-like n=1 Tax=Thamnophis sirtalis TaxID=35019 RepID=A0A6I9YK79_9SAUR|nr:PREDICTED: RIMS-binding protein 2-like [Thamnophis sirtalis]